ncbi:MAG TPA: hypothetical protein VIL00_00325 [Pseudonocardiaceae bacterium]
MLTLALTGLGMAASGALLCALAARLDHPPHRTDTTIRARARARRAGTLTVAQLIARLEHEYATRTTGHHRRPPCPHRRRPAMAVPAGRLLAEAGRG